MQSASNRVNSTPSVKLTHCARLIFAAGGDGNRPGDTRTRSATVTVRIKYRRGDVTLEASRSGHILASESPFLLDNRDQLWGL